MKNTGKGVRKFVCVSDNHGDQVDVPTRRAFFEFMKFWKPQVRIHMGDCWDFACLRKGASEGESRGRLQDDVDQGIAWVRDMRPTHFLRGNHDERLWDAAKCDDGKLADFASYLVIDIKEALGDAYMLPYDKRAGVLRIGRLKCVHGYNSGITAARLAAQIYGSCLMGHIHSIDQFSIPGLERRIGRAIGCACKLSMDYNRAQAATLRQSHGWGYGLLLPGGEYVYFQAEQVAGKWFFPSEMITV